MKSEINKIVMMGFTLALLIVAGCGGSNNNAVAPAPVPVSSNGYAGSCGSVGGTPVDSSNSALQATLTGGSGSNSMAVSLFYSGTASGYNTSASINGSAQMVFPAMQSIWSYLTNNQGGQIQQTNFCVSSATINGGQPTPGTLGAASGNSPCGYSGKGLSLTMRGLVQFPQNQGYNPTGTFQDIVEVNIGPSTQYPAVICQGRIYVYATVKVSSDAARTYTLN